MRIPIPSMFVKGSAAFSPDRRHRYLLEREWDSTKERLLFIMLNPSTATEEDNDPTVERCQVRAVASGFGSLLVANLFAWRSTDPDELLRVADPVGPENDSMIFHAAARAALVVAAWGNHKAVRGRAAKVLSLIRLAGRVPHALRRNADGSPSHPLYLDYDLKPFPMEAQQDES